MLASDDLFIYFDILQARITCLIGRGLVSVQHTSHAQNHSHKKRKQKEKGYSKINIDVTDILLSIQGKAIENLNVAALTIQRSSFAGDKEQLSQCPKNAFVFNRRCS